MVLKKGRREAEEEEQSLKPIPIEEYWWQFFSQEIFHRLPANQLQTIKGFCRNWFRTISSPNFVRLHLKIYNESIIRVVVKNEGRVVEYKFNINSSDLEETNQITYPPAIHRSTLLGSCDGLLCLHYQGSSRSIEASHRSIELYNPSTGKYFRPNSSLIDTTIYNVRCYWFGQHPCFGEYVLVLGCFYGEVIVVYKLNSRSNLRKMHSTTCSIDPQVHFSFHERIGTLLHGALHWPAQRNLPQDQVIYTYNLDDNKYLEISPPVQDRDFKLGVVDGCLFAILKPTNAQGSEFEMWIMKEYGVQQSWTKYANIQGLNSFGYRNCVYDVIPLGFFLNGDLILDVDQCKLIKYNFNDNKAELLMHHEYGNAIICVDSLESPKIVGT